MQCRIHGRCGIEQQRREQAGGSDENLGGGEMPLRTMRPDNTLPIARPAMNAASTVLAAYTVTPKTTDNRRSQRTW